MFAEDISEDFSEDRRYHICWILVVFLDIFEIFAEDCFLLRSFRKFLPSGFLPLSRFQLRVGPRNPGTTTTKSTINIASAKLGAVRILPFSLLGGRFGHFLFFCSGRGRGCPGRRGGGFLVENPRGGGSRRGGGGVRGPGGCLREFFRGGGLNMPPPPNFGQKIGTLDLFNIPTC